MGLGTDSEGLRTVMALRKLHTLAAALTAALLLATGGVGAQETPPEAEGEIESEAKVDWIDGRLDVGIDARRTDRDSDVELEQYLSVDIKPPKYEKLSVRGALWMIEDVDGRESGTSTLRNLNDASSGSVRARLLYLYLEADDILGDSTLRIGRQRILESTIYNRIDGIYFKKRMETWDWYAFGGARASIYNDVHNDHVLGGGIGWRPLATTRIALDFFYGEEHRDDEVRLTPLAWLLRAPYPRRVQSHIDSRQVALSVSHQIALKHHLFGRYTWHEGDSDEFEISATGVVTARDVVYDLSYRKRLNLLTDRTSDVTGYYRVLGALNEYDDIQGALHVPLNDRFTLSFELQWHDTDGDRDLGNRDYERYALVLGASDLGPGIDAELALELWDVSDGESTWAITGEVSKAWEALELTLGADFERFEDRIVLHRPEARNIARLLNVLNPAVFPRYNPLVPFLDTRTLDYHENIYSFYLRADYALDEKQSLWAEISFEEDDGPDSPYWRFQAEYSIRF
jgi:hypothetical protein